MLNLDAIKKANEERKAIRNKATLGPWRLESSYHTGVAIFSREKQVVFSANSGYGYSCKSSDIAFVISARDDNVPEVIDQLIAEIERLREAAKQEAMLEVAERVVSGWTQLQGQRQGKEKE